MSINKVLTIAGSDSGGGAGIQADLKTFTSLDVYGTSVITAVTAQNTVGVDGIHNIPGSFVSQQITSVLGDIGADAIKIGMLSNADIITAIATTLREFYPDFSPIPNLTLDPVMIASSGAQLLDNDAIKALITKLLPLTFILTPNVPEALKILEATGHKNCSVNDIQSVDDMKAAAKALSSLGPTIVVVKGGHLPLQKGTDVGVGSKFEQNICSSAKFDTPMELVDVVYDSRNDTFTEFRHTLLPVKNTHGTGCTLSAAISSYLAKGCGALDSIKKSVDYVQAAIQSGFSIGRGHAPLNHFHAIVPRALPLPTKHNPCPLKADMIAACGSIWDDYVDHAFVRGIGDGSLPKECFVHYIIQDYFFLQNYARAYALAAAKVSTLVESTQFANTVILIHKETKMHVEFCARWGVSFEDIQATPESMANVAYTRYVLDVGARGDVLDLLLAMAPCSIGYGEIGAQLMKDPKTLKGSANLYWDWIQAYAGKEYHDGMNNSIETLEKMAAKVQPSQERLTQMQKIFRDATKLEVAFWDMGLNRT